MGERQAEPTLLVGAEERRRVDRPAAVLAVGRRRAPATSPATVIDRG
jgi:hypothetical protein